MVLHNVDIINQGLCDIHIYGQEIVQIAGCGMPSNDLFNIYFKDCIAFPGLINSHDHLDFNLFPKLGNYIYEDYVEWGNDIHQQNKDVINAVLNVPKALRTKWGVYKNLLNGITTVVQHGEKLTVGNSPINIFNNCHSLHSVRLEKHWKRKLNKPFVDKWPFVTHVGEGTNAAAYSEINELIRWNVFNRELIAIHGVAMDNKQAEHFKGLIWCPDSNIFLLGKTAEINTLKTSTQIVFGTDSTVSASWSIWEQLRLTRKLKLLTDEELLNSVTQAPAKLWHLNKQGKLKEKSIADIIIVKKKNISANYYETFFAIEPADIMLVICNGNIVLFDEGLLNQLDNINIWFSKIVINNAIKYIIGDLENLIKEIKTYYPDVVLPIELV